MDIQNYLQRINYDGPVTPTASTLHRIHLTHVQSIPFENLDIHCGIPIVLEFQALYEKVIKRHRGGFCYELNGLFAWLLHELGFQVTLLFASDAHKDGDFGPPFDHLTLQVQCTADTVTPDTIWLADVGWGDIFCNPLRLDHLNVEQHEGLRAYRIDREGKYHILWQRNYDGDWERQYRFTLEPRALVDFERMCAYHQQSAASLFTQQRICTLATPNGRITLEDQKLILTEDGQRQEQVVSADEYQVLLAKWFDIELRE